jgi:uncharacterized membrane protein
MRRENLWRRSSPWLIPLLYAGCAFAGGLSFPRIEHLIFPHLMSQLSVATATSIYSSIASGMIALTGIVFSLSFVMIQFSATAYSPRLVLWLARDRALSHALGLFTATFIYAIAALAGVDRNGNSKVPAISAWVVVVLLMASVVMLISLIYRIERLQVNRMLTFTGDQGRRAIRDLYESSAAIPAAPLAWPPARLSEAQVLLHRGKPKALQYIDLAGLLHLADIAKGTIGFTVAIGDTLMDGMELLRVFGASAMIEERKLRRCVGLGEKRTFEQDPKYALRLLVDVAIRGLSPAINDPTTAVQSLDIIGDLLLRLGRCPNLEVGSFRGPDGKVRLMVPVPAWEDYVCLAFSEIQFYGASSTQVTRRLAALITDLISLLPESRHAALRGWETRLNATVDRAFAQDAAGRLEASVEDRQGLGLDRRAPSLPSTLSITGVKPKSA